MLFSILTSNNSFIKLIKWLVNNIFIQLTWKLILKQGRVSDYSSEIPEDGVINRANVFKHTIIIK